MQQGTPDPHASVSEHHAEHPVGVPLTVYVEQGSDPGVKGTSASTDRGVACSAKEHRAAAHRVGSDAAARAPRGCQRAFTRIWAPGSLARLAQVKMVVVLTRSFTRRSLCCYVYSGTVHLGLDVRVDGVRKCRFFLDRCHKHRRHLPVVRTTCSAETGIDREDGHQNRGERKHNPCPHRRIHTPTRTARQPTHQLRTCCRRRASDGWSSFCTFHQ